MNIHTFNQFTYFLKRFPNLAPFIFIQAISEAFCLLRRQHRQESCDTNQISVPVYKSKLCDVYICRVAVERCQAHKPYFPIAG
jgi:hypothetical protein